MFHPKCALIRDRIWTSPVLRFLWRIKLRVLTWRVFRNVRWIQRGHEVLLRENDAVVYATFRNGALYLENFVRHYQRLGVTKIVLMDNGSTDESVEILSRYPEVGLVQSDLPYSKFHLGFRHYFLLSQVRNGWGINVDIDELLDFPSSSDVLLKEFLTYLNEHHFTAVQGYMLDRYSKDPLGKANSRPGDDFSLKCPYYSLGDIESRPYSAKEIGPRGSQGSADICDYRGGVRSRFFAQHTRLSKFPLVRRRRAHVANVHRIFNAHRADVSVVLNHYRFLDDVEAVVRNFKKLNHKRYDELIKLFDDGGDAVVYREVDKRWRGVDALVEEGFLEVSERYSVWIKQRSAD